jgi:hypothetical protein
MKCNCCNRLIADNHRLVTENERLLSVLEDEREAIGHYVRIANRLENELSELKGKVLSVAKDYCGAPA